MSVHPSPLDATQAAAKALEIPLFALRQIDTFYGAVQVHFGVDLDVPEGRIVCLLGGNGSGKSTCMKVALGLHPVRAGQILWRNTDRTRLNTPGIVRQGVASVPEGRRLFGQMTVRQNVLMGAFTRHDRRAIGQDFDHVLGLFPQLASRLPQLAGTLSGGEQQMVAMARALMSRPRLICMDEPTMGLSPLYVDKVLALIQHVNAQGVSVLMVEQNAHLALQIAHHGVVMQAGRVVLQGTAADLRADPRLRDAYLGAAHTQARAATAP